MATRKRATRQSGLVGRAVSAGRRAWKEAEGRMPPDLRRQVDRRIKDADKMARAAIKQLQVQVNRASSRADVNSVLKRIDGLTKQARQITRATGPRKAAPTKRAAPTGRAASTTRAASRTKKPATATRRAATPKRATTRRTTPRRARPVEMPVTPMTGPMGSTGEVEIIEVIEP